MSSVNPYQTPNSQQADEQEIIEVVAASRWLRFANYVIDYIGFIVLSFFIGLATAFFGDEALAHLEQIPDILFGVAIMMIYYLPLEALTGRTLGKWITGTKVVNAEGGQASFGQVMGRTLCRFIPFEAFSFFSNSRRGWHDSIPKTFVVKAR
ncbi:RDD family protein [Halioxenophilus sp. WMMB6]|uniref:RDD family protein n=1 Tax=Halioxenophilus sp. WMMB6 TaxID=3073815 RepID=UPI00295E5E66|nr:RDD family protein [Halioxenophilus sp. WMMB6]